MTCKLKKIWTKDHSEHPNMFSCTLLLLSLIIKALIIDKAKHDFFIC